MQALNIHLDQETFLAFENFYRPFFASDWEALIEALLKPKSQVARLNGHSQEAQTLFGAAQVDVRLAAFKACFLQGPRALLQDSQGLQVFYPMDLASLFPVAALDLQSFDQALDLCAGPGGKALMMSEKTSQLHLNEPSGPRLNRLKGLIKAYVPKAKQEAFRFFRQEGQRWGLRKSSYDKILVDAPCSGERHLLSQPEHFGQWTPKRTKNLAHRQYALLTAAWEALKPGGRLVYATCALSPAENDRVVARFLKKKPARLLQKTWEWGSATDFGWRILPGLHGNWGPAYWSVLEKEA